MTKPTDAERCLERAAQLRTSPTIGDAIPHFAERTAAERDRPLTPVQFSEALQIIAGRPIPPALGEFALQERQGLLDEIKRLRFAAEQVCWFDWSRNDHDAVRTIDQLRAALAPQERIPLAQQAAAQRSIINAAGACSADVLGKGPVPGESPGALAPAAPVCHNITSNAKPCVNMKFIERDSLTNANAYRCAVCGLTEIR